VKSVEPDQTRAARASPRISVVLPVYNAQAFLDAAVDSVLAQTFGDFELLAIDDGSTDATAAILDRLARRDRRMIVVRQANAGIVAALNHGLALARGEFVARMDADDVACPERFARQAAFLDAHPDVAVVGSAITLVDAQGRTIRHVQYPESPAAAAAFLATGSPLAHPAAMMRRAAVLAVGGYRRAFEYAEDYDLWLRMAERHSLANLPDRLLLYRQHGAKLSFSRAAEQALATGLARVAASRRRAGQPDPTAGLAALSLADLDRLGLSPQEKAAVILDIVDACLAVDFWRGESEHLDRVVELLRGLDVDAAPRSRLVRARLMVGRRLAHRGRLLAAAGWIAHAVAGRAGDMKHAGAILLDRARRMIASIGANSARG
jgi:Glycosyl transferase family 2